jgi:hypothetical protein
VKIFKYNPTDRMPKGAEILTIKLQNDEAKVWAKVDPKAELVTRIIVGVYTGFDSFDGTYINTTIYESGIVIHWFDLGELQCDNSAKT